jgi:hypothetical protein
MHKPLVWFLTGIVAVTVLAFGSTEAARRTVLFEQFINAGCG